MTLREPKGIGFISQLIYTLLCDCNEQFCHQLPPRYRLLKDELHNKARKKAGNEGGENETRDLQKVGMRLWASFLE